MDLSHPPLSLENQAMIRIAINILISEEMISFIGSHPGPEYGDEVWEEALDRAEELARSVHLSNNMNYKLLNTVKPIFFKITKWIIKHFFENTLDYDQVEYCLSKLRFAPEGHIDSKKTADVLIEDENVGIDCRYKLACAYASEDQIRGLWRRMSPDQFYNKDVDTISLHEMPLTAFWSFYMENQLQKLEPVINNDQVTAFEYALLKSAEMVGSVSSTRYFWDKLSPEQKLGSTKNVARVAARSFSGDTLIFILSQIDAAQQRELLTDDDMALLEILFRWPYQEIFLRAAMFIHESITPERFFVLLNTMTRNVSFDYQNVLQAFWCQSSVECRRYVIQDDKIIQLMDNLFRQDYYKVVLVVWGEFEPDEKQRKFIHISHRLVRELNNSVLYPLTNLFLPTPFAADKFKNHMDDHVKLESLTNPELFQIWNTHGRINLFHCIDSCFHEFNA